MKLLTLIALSALALPVMPAAASECPAVLQHEMPKLRSKDSVDLCQTFQGKALVVVNTASHCGFTPQFKGPRGALSALQGRRLGGAGRAIGRLLPGVGR